LTRWRGAKPARFCGRRWRCVRRIRLAGAAEDLILCCRTRIQEYYATLSAPFMSDPNLEHERLENLLVAYDFLDRAKSDDWRQGLDLDPVHLYRSTPWESVSEPANCIFDEYFVAIAEHGPGPEEAALNNRTGRGPFNLLNKAFRQELAPATFGNDPSIPKEEGVELVRRGQLRVLEELDRADLAPPVRDHIKARYQRRLDRLAAGQTELSEGVDGLHTQLRAWGLM